MSTILTFFLVFLQVLVNLQNCGKVSAYFDTGKSDMQCSQIRHCARELYCLYFPFSPNPFDPKNPLLLNTCCLQDDGDSGPFYCYCCDDSGTTCGDSNCARYASGASRSGDRLASFSNFSLISGQDDEDDDGKQFGILFRKGKNELI